MQPQGYFLPGLCDVVSTPKILPDGCSFGWHEFRLTALHLPGQTLYHAGLVVERGGHRTLLCGDSFAPLGLDDYCDENRNLAGDGRGYKYCLELLEKYRIDDMINEHQSEAFAFSSEYIEFLRRGLAERERLCEETLTLGAGFGTDDSPVRAWPLEGFSPAGRPYRLSVQITAHGRDEIAVRPRLPDGWSIEGEVEKRLTTLERTSGSSFFSNGELSPDAALEFLITPPPDTCGRFLIPIDCTINGLFLGSLAPAILVVL